MTQPVAIDDGLRVMLTVAEAGRRLSLGRSTVYKLLASGALESVHIGHLRSIPLDCLIGLLEECRRTQNPRVG